MGLTHPADGSLRLPHAELQDEEKGLSHWAPRVFYHEVHLLLSSPKQLELPGDLVQEGTLAIPQAFRDPDHVGVCCSRRAFNPSVAHVGPFTAGSPDSLFLICTLLTKIT